MFPSPITIGPRATGAEAEALMEARRMRHLPVLDENHLVGMITDRDIRLASMPRPRKEPKQPDALLQLIRVEQLLKALLALLKSEGSQARGMPRKRRRPL